MLSCCDDASSNRRPFVIHSIFLPTCSSNQSSMAFSMCGAHVGHVFSGHKLGPGVPMPVPFGYLLVMYD